MKSIIYHLPSMAYMEGVAADQLAEKSPHEGVTSAVGVHDLLGCDDKHGVFVDLSLVHDNSRVGSLRNNHSAGALGVDLLGHIRQPSLRESLFTAVTLGSCEIFRAISFTSFVPHLLESEKASASDSLPNT